MTPPRPTGPDAPARRPAVRAPRPAVPARRPAVPAPAAEEQPAAGEEQAAAGEEQGDVGEEPAVRTFGLWTPSAPAPALFPRRTARALDALRREGWDYRAADSFPSVGDASAAPPRKLAADLHALVRSGVDAVLAASGGWTSALVLPYLDFELLAEAQVPLIGYSDVSVLLWAYAAHDVPAVHGPMLVSEFGHYTGPFPYTLSGLRNALAGRGGALTAPSHWTEDNPWWDREDERALEMREATPWRVLRHGQARGPLLAGCLPAVTSLFGTPFMPPTDEHVLFLEDFGMAPDRFLSLLAQWRNSGRLEHLGGLVLGRRSRPGAAPGGYADFDDALLNLLGGIDIPVVVDVDFGHTEPRLSLALGAEVEITTDPLHLYVKQPTGGRRRAGTEDLREKLR